ncbi:hypothetical protein TNCV_135811 [Trichonephila clavipes]|nr:hypothetical protein TNCV_135811 [Trichonephila clavipes]
MKDLCSDALIGRDILNRHSSVEIGFDGKKQFSLSRDDVMTFNSLKDDVANAALTTIEDDIPFRVATSSSDFAIGATLSQA